MNDCKPSDNQSFPLVSTSDMETHQNKVIAAKRAEGVSPNVEEVRLRFNPIPAHILTSQAESFFTVLMKKRLDVNEMANVIGHMGKMLLAYAERIDGAVRTAREGSNGPN